MPPEGSGGQHPGEVRAGGDRAALIGHPLHPVAGVGEEVLRRRLARASTPVVIGMARNPTSPMSW